MLEGRKIDKRDKHLPQSFEELIEMYDLEKLDLETLYTQVNGKYTTAVWSAGTNTCTWIAPKDGLYLMFAYFNMANDSKAKVYKQLQLRGTAERVSGSILLYQIGTTSSSDSENNYKGIAAYQGSILVKAKKGQIIEPYIHCPEAGIEWSVTLTGLFLK